MHKLTDPSFQSRVAAQKSSESVRESVGTLNPVTTTLPSKASGVERSR